MSFNYTVYDVTLSPLTPLHIGSGRTLLNEFDYAVYKERAWRINENALLDAQNADDPRLVELLSRTPPAQLLKPADFRPDSPFIRYKLGGKPRASGRGAQLQEMLKTARDEAYLPGSSLKGAIRTALAWQGWAEKKMKPDARDLERNRKFAGRRIEKKIMGPDANHDLLRALHVGDSVAVGKDCFMVLNAQALTPGSLGTPIELEAVAPDTPFHLNIKVDKQLFSQWAKQHHLKLGGNAVWLDNLAQTIQQHTAQRLKDELAWYKDRRGAEITAGFYRQLLGASLPANACLLQLGWGSGWGGKTYGSHLTGDQPFMERIISNYRLAKGKRRSGDPFPKSRRVAAQVVKDNWGKAKQRPAMPMGWALMEMTEKKP